MLKNISLQFSIHFFTDIRPENCRDYFSRDNLFASAATTCVDVTIDPQGPGIGDPMNPDPVAVQCCKTSATDYCTQVIAYIYFILLLLSAIFRLNFFTRIIFKLPKENFPSKTTKLNRNIYTLTSHTNM